MTDGSRAELVLTEFWAVNEGARRLLMQMQFSAKSPQHRYAGALLVTILEEARAIGYCLERGDRTGAFVILRSLFEAHADLKNLSERAEYVEVMLASSLQERLKTVRNAINDDGSNPFLVSLKANSGPEFVAELERKKAELEARGVTALNVFERFRRARLKKEYEGQYAKLCWHAHHNLHSLEARHFDAEGALVAFRRPDWEDLQMLTDTTAGIAVASVVLVSSMLQEGGEARGCGELVSALEKLRGFWNTGA